MKWAKTDNDNIKAKIMLRVLAVRSLDKPRVLECFAGEGRLWDAVQKETGKRISRVRIEKERGKGRSITGDSLKFLLACDLSQYDVIDLDAYGIPFDHMECLFARAYTGTVVVTFIRTAYGALPFGIMKSSGINTKQIKKCPTLFYRKAEKYLHNYLHNNGITHILLYEFAGSGSHKKYFSYQQGVTQ